MSLWPGNPSTMMLLHQPDQDAVEQDIKLNISAKISSGIYKLVLNKNTELNIWKHFAMIQKSSDGTMINDYYYCIHCTAVFRRGTQQTGNLYRHMSKCPIKFCTTAIKITEHDDLEEIKEKIKKGVYKLVLRQCNNTREDDIWKKYAMVRKTADGSIVAGYYCCIMCTKVFKSTPANLQRHLDECPKNRNIVCAIQSDLSIITPQGQENLIKSEIRDKLESGIYKLAMNCSHGVLWKNYTIITKAEDGSIVEGYCCCLHCSKILKNHKKQWTNLYRHTRLCFKNQRTNKFDDNKIWSYGLNDNNTGREIKNTTNKADTGELGCWRRSEDEKIKSEHSSSSRSEDDKTTYQESEKINTEINVFEPDILFCYDSEDDDIITISDDEECPTSNSIVWQTYSKTDVNVEDSSKSLQIHNDESGFHLKSEDDENSNTGQLFSYDSEDDDIISVSEDELIEVEKCRIPKSSAWQTFALILTDEGNAELSCRQCNMVLENDYKSKLRVKEHKCSNADKRNYLRVIPSQRDMEEKIKLEIANKLKVGIFKSTKNYRKKGWVWKVFDAITSTISGRIVEDYACCSICTKIFKCHSMRTGIQHNHKCYRKFIYLLKVEMDANNSYAPLDAEAMEILEKDIKDKMKADCKMNTNRRGKRFFDISMTDGLPMKEMVCCRLCNVAFCKDNLQQHKCGPLKEKSKDRIYATQSTGNKLKVEKDKRKSEIFSNISKGFYKVVMKQSGKSAVWNIFAMILETTNGSLVKDYLYCTKCHIMMSYDGVRTSNLQRHPCVRSSRRYNKAMACNNEPKEENCKKRSPSNVNEEENEYSIKRPRTDEDEEQDDTFTITEEGVMGCRQCKSVLEYDGTKRQLEEHKCLRQTITSGNEIDAKPKENGKANITKNEINANLKEDYNYNFNFNSSLLRIISNSFTVDIMNTRG